MGDIAALSAALVEAISVLPLDQRVAELNRVRTELHLVSPFSQEPVDLILWVKAEEIEANDYNPNKVAPPEMRLLEHSVREDGYTQPIVTYADSDDSRTVIDGFHRNRVGRETLDIRDRLHGYLPVTTVNTDRTSRSDRIAATIRHNRARGRHMVSAMSDIVIELSKRNWDDKRIAKELGMDTDEVLRLKQIGGLAELFSDRDFSEAWDTQ
ncbi:MAG: ParB-like nuclease domain-containing protein [Alphaproteobacteria bacterium]|nr:MAG: ParB-like nuclease domain-containing protein [Alphaproteobacteria bacterium]